MKTLTQEGLNPGQEFFAGGWRDILFPANFGCFKKSEILVSGPGRHGCRRSSYLKICRKDEVFNIKFDVFRSTVGAIVAMRFCG